MLGECHGHVIMDGKNYKEAVGFHRNGVNETAIRQCFRIYQQKQILFFRDGGDALGVSQRAKEIAPEYGIDYRSPIFAIHKKGHYGGIVGRSYEDLKEYKCLVQEVKRLKGDFIKIMVSGIMEFQNFGKLSEEGLTGEEIRQMVQIAKAEGLAVMVHCNGARTMEAAAKAGADSIEHGAYGDEEALEAMKEAGCIWTPTISPVANMIGCGRFPDPVLKEIQALLERNIRIFRNAGGRIALGSDAGAYMVPHGKGTETEWNYLKNLVSLEHLEETEKMIRERFQRHEV